LTWGQAFSSQVTTDAATLGVPTPTATNLAGKVSDYADALAAATNESTRTKGKVAAKNTARASLRQAVSDVAKLIYGTATVSDEQLTDLGLTVYDRHPTPVAPVVLAPELIVKTVIGRVVRYQLKDASVEGTRRRPVNARGALVLTYVGETPPAADSGQWIVQGIVTKPLAVVQYPDSVEPGQRCWATAMWVGTRGQFSAACDPVSTYLQIGPMAEAA
jgi:hypothetical protein